MNLVVPAWWVACACLLFAAAGGSHAGPDAISRAGGAAAAAEMDSYLQAQKVNHSIGVSDEKDGPQGPLTIKVYGELGDAREDAICAALASIARRTRTETSTLQFFALEQASGPVNFQSSHLPSGNGEVTVNRNAIAPVYRLRRTVRL